MKVADWLPDVGAEDGAQSDAGCWGDARRLALRLRHAGLGRMALDLALEVLLVFTVLKVPLTYYTHRRCSSGSVLAVTHVGKQLPLLAADDLASDCECVFTVKRRFTTSCATSLAP